MSRSLTTKIKAANSALMANGNLDAVSEFFASDYVTHLTEEDMTGGHDAIRRVLGMYRRAFADLKVEVEILVESRTESPGNERSGPLKATSRGSLRLVVPSCGVTW